MKRTLILLLCLLALSGCAKKETVARDETLAMLPTEAAEPPATCPPDGNPNDVTCLGSYSGEADPGRVVAAIGDRELTNGVLTAFYWAEAAAYRGENREIMPDFSVPLDVQACPLDESVGTWQQYFLKRALNAWHSAQALVLRSETEILPTEAAYQPDKELHASWLSDKPVTRFLYGYNDKYQNNTMHQAYLDSIPEKLAALAGEKGYGSAEQMARDAFGASEGDVEAFVRLYNQGYMYFTFLSYDLAPGQPAVDALAATSLEQGRRVNIRHILMAGETEAKNLLTSWQKDRFTGENLFGELAVKHSLDTGTAAVGGAYRGLKQGQLEKTLDAWCFDPARQPGDTTILMTARGAHILYFSGAEEASRMEAERTLTGRMEAEFAAEARERFPMEVDYAAIRLGTGDAEVGLGEILYPDIAHERFPEVPLYIQNDYGSTRYGSQLLSSHGCGICCLAMMGTYMTDTVMTPPELAAKLGRYCLVSGTDATMFIRESSGLGFYFREKINDYRKAAEVLKAGYPIITVQTKGMWTKGGHYMLLESMTQDDMVKVRDSSLKNYGKLEGHAADEFPWKNIVTTGMGCWVFEKKVTHLPACTRCGAGEGIAQGYVCEKCEKALIRRKAYLGL